MKASGNYNLTLDSRSACATNSLSLHIYDERGRQITRSGRNPYTLTARLKPGNYIVVVAGEVPANKNITLGYDFKSVPVSRR